MPLLAPQQYDDVKAYFDSTGEPQPPKARRQRRDRRSSRAKAAGDLKAAGFLIAGIGAGAVGNNKDCSRISPGTSSNYTLTVRTADGTGSGWAGADHPDWSQVDVKGVARRARSRRRGSRAIRSRSSRAATP